MIVFIGWAWHAFRMIFHRLEWYDWVAYALPAADWVERGVLGTPQLGPQFHFDRTWLFNAPLMGAGPAPFYALLGTGRISYLIGLSLFALLNLAAYTWVIRKALKLPGLALSLFGAMAILGNRIYLSSYANQRYDLLAYAAMLLAFAPESTSTSRPNAAPAWWRWALAGLLPLLHPALVPASLLWLAVEIALMLRNTRRRSSMDDVETPGRISPVGPILFALFWILTACWYGRSEGLNSQFLPHLRFHSARTAEGSNAGRIFDTVSAFPFAFPTLATTLLIAALALGLVLAFRRVSIRIVLPAVLIVGVVALDLLRGFSYWGFYLLGLAPCFLFAFGDSPRPRRLALAVVLTFAAAQTAVALRLDRSVRASLADQGEAIAFLVAETQPGESIVVGPPFLLASAPRSLPDGRHVLYVLPQPFYLLDFDRDLYRSQIAAQTTTYIGQADWFHRITIGGGLGQASAPLYDHDPVDVHKTRFFGDDVIIAHRRGPGSTTQAPAAISRP